MAEPDAPEASRDDGVARDEGGLLPSGGGYAGYPFPNEGFG